MLADNARADERELHEQVALRLRARFILLDVDWIYELASARVDADAASRIDRAIDDALQREWEAERRGERPTDAERDRYRVWTDVFQLDLADARRAAVTFNTLDDHARRVFFALIIEERPVGQCVDAGLGDRKTLGQIVRAVFRAVLDAHAAS